MDKQSLQTLDFPDISSLTNDSATRYSQQIRTHLRPNLLALLKYSDEQYSNEVNEYEKGDLIADQIEKLDDYALKLDQLILQQNPPAPSQLWSPDYDIISKVEDKYIHATAPLFFSAESLTNVHGPVMLFHFATLAEEILKPEEKITHLKKNSFKKLVTCHINLYICDVEYGFPFDSAKLKKQACISGKFILNNNRVLNFFGVEIKQKPVTQFANFNSLATGFLPSNTYAEMQDGIFRLQLKSDFTDFKFPKKGLNTALILMTILDIWMLMMLMVPRPERTKLLISIQELEIPDNFLKLLSSKTYVEFKPLIANSRYLSDDSIMLPSEFRFSTMGNKWTSVKLALSTLPYYRFLT